MKVVHLNTNPRWGGGEHQVLQLILGMRRRGHGAILVARPGGELFERARSSGKVEVHPFDFRSRYDPFAVARLRRLLVRLGADLLHLHDGHAVALGLPAARRVPGLGLVLHRRISSPMRRNPLTRARYRSTRIDAFIAVSEAARGSLLDIAVEPARTHVVPSGVNAELLTPPACRLAARRAVDLTEGATWVGTVGTLERKKDIATFVRMAVLLAERDDELRFVVVGDGRQRAELQGMALEAGLGSRLIFTGQVPDAHRYIAAMDVFVFPSLREGSPGVVKEAMALGVPVVAARSPGTVEVLEAGCGRCVPPGDERAFADSVLAHLADPHGARLDAEAARARVAEHFSIDLTVERTLAVYRSILAPAHAQPAGPPPSLAPAPPPVQPSRVAATEASVFDEALSSVESPVQGSR